MKDEYDREKDNYDVLKDDYEGVTIIDESIIPWTHNSKGKNQNQINWNFNDFNLFYFC